MEKYKICPNPNCGKHNKPKAIECAWCETDLSSVKPTDDTTETAREKAENSHSENEGAIDRLNHMHQSGKMIRLCESCGTHNAANARKCSSCGEDISDVTPTPEIREDNSTQKDVKSKYELLSLEGDFSFEIPEGKTRIGREEKLKEYLEHKSYVSRKHAEFDLSDGVLSIMNLSNTNYTYVNNKKIADQRPVVLHDGDEVGLGGNVTSGERQDQAAYFQIKVN